MQTAQHVVKHAEQVKTTASASWYWRFGLFTQSLHALMARMAQTEPRDLCASSTCSQTWQNSGQALIAGSSLHPSRSTSWCQHTTYTGTARVLDQFRLLYVYGYCTYVEPHSSTRRRMAQLCHHTTPHPIHVCPSFCPPATPPCIHVCPHPAQC